MYVSCVERSIVPLYLTVPYSDIKLGFFLVVVDVVVVVVVVVFEQLSTPSS